MTDPSFTSTYRIESLARGLLVLSSFSTERPALSLTDIAQHLQLNKTTTYRLLSTLEGLGYLQRDPQTKLYRPALELLRLGFVVLSGMQVRQVAMPHLRQLVDDVQETINLAIPAKQEIVYIDRLGGRHMLNIYRPVGSRLPAYCTSIGKAMLAFLPPEELEAALEATSWKKHTEETRLTPDALKEDLKLVRRRGFATSCGELFPELYAVAAPIHQKDGQVIAAVNISVPSHRATCDRLVNELGPKVLETARQISNGLGYS